MAYDSQMGASGAMTGAAVGTAVMPGVGTAVGAGAGLLMGFMGGGKKGPDYSGVTAQFKARQDQIGAFAASLAASRAKYMTSLNNMYNNAYARFSGNAEAGFASRGMSVSGGAFASTLAKETGRLQNEGDVMAAGMEREDINSVDKAYGINSGSYMSAISPGAGMAYNADREDSRALGGFAGQLAMRAVGPTLDNGDYYGSRGPSTTTKLADFNRYGPVGGGGAWDKLGVNK